MDKKPVSVRSLVLEVTRRCNLCCEHCLRGDAQDLDMSRDCIDTLLEQVDGIGSVCFTGGEPTLNLDIVKYFFERADELGKMPNHFYIVTNGQENQVELAHIALDLYDRMDDKECCGVAISMDRFHLPPRSRILETLSFCHPDKTHDGHDDRWIINRGRAKENGLGRTCGYGPDEFEMDWSDREVTVDQLYVSANGLIHYDCDLDYATVDRDAIAGVGNLEAYFNGLVEPTGKEE